jgi:cyclic 2,3-diphosphoglycerate synthetase
VTSRALAIVDGEHYPSVVRDALAELPYEIVAAVLVGGTEKLRGEEDYGVPLAPNVEAAIDRYRPELVLDLSDEPVLGPVERLALAGRVLNHGIPYAGADFRFDPPALEPFDLPSVAVVGTGKRVGKTAVTGHLARLVSGRRRVVVVAMGRGGPADPETITVPPTVDALVAMSRAGRHAASDHLETAALVGVETVGCRRCGGGLAGAVFASNVAEGARVARALEPDLVVFDGSGAALPPVAADRTIVAVGGHQDPAVAAGYLNGFRLLRADLAVVTMAEAGTEWERVRDAVAEVVPTGVDVLATVLRPRPLVEIRGRTVAYFCTAPPSAHAVLASHLASVHGAEVVHVSGNLADRAALRSELEDVRADVLLVELKAAAIDVVAELGLAGGAEVVLAANDLEAVEEGPDLDDMLLEMAGIRV